jgi:hypothetical protein
MAAFQIDTAFGAVGQGRITCWHERRARGDTEMGVAWLRNVARLTESDRAAGRDKGQR